MNIQFDNRVLKDISIEMAHVDALVAAGSSKTVVLDDNNGLAQNNFIIIGDIFLPRSEITMIEDAVVAGTDIVADSLTFPHNPREIVRYIPYNQVKLYHAATLTGTKSLVETKTIDVDQRYTEFVVADDATGYYFFTLYNSQSTDESDYSPGILATEYTNKTRSAIRSFVEDFYDDDLSDPKLDRMIQSVLDQIFAMRAWKFREATATFTPTTGTYAYDIVDDVGIDDWGMLVSARTATQMMRVITNDQDDILSLNPLTLLPHTIFEWAGQLIIRIPTAEEITIKYLKSTEQLLTSGTKTSVPLASCVAFGVLELLYMPKDRQMSRDFASKYAMSLKTMTKDDEKDVEIHSLPEAGAPRDEFTRTPQIT